MVKNDLLQKLKMREWEYKDSLYTPLMHSVEYLNCISDPLLSVVIISWRLHPDTINNLIALERQKKSHEFEVIFVNNGADVSAFSSLLPYIDTYVSLNENTGAYIARNIGALYCKAPILLFLEDDGIPDNQLIESYMMVYKKYIAYSVQGVYLHKTNTRLNYRQSHYYLGNTFFPKCSNLEGNTSYIASIFFEVGGWDDEINFGGGGRELALRIFNRYPEYHKQIYSPISIIYHDFASSIEHLQSKVLKQNKSFERLAEKHEDWHSFAASWKAFQGNEEMLELKSGWTANDEEQLRALYNQINSRNKSRINEYEETRISLFDQPRLTDLIDIQHRSKKICIFGAGTYGEMFHDSLQQFQLRVDCFSDNNTAVWNTEKRGVPIISPDNLTAEHYVFIVSKWNYEIILQLEERGFLPSENFIVVY